MMAGMLRSEFEPGSTRWAVRRAQWRAIGITEEDFHKPKIMVSQLSRRSLCATSTLMRSRRSSSRRFWRRAACRLRSAPRPATSLRAPARRPATNAYPRPDRERHRGHGRGAQLDGMVCLSSCDKTTPGHLMASARLNIPSIVVPCGYQTGGMCAGRHVDIDDVYESVGSVASGKTTLEELGEMTETAIQAPGAALGLQRRTPCTCSPRRWHGAAGQRGLRAGSEKMSISPERPAVESLRWCGRICVLGTCSPPWPSRTPSRSTSQSGVRELCRHLAAVVTEAELDLDITSIFEERTEDASLVCVVRPNGPV